MLPSLRGLPICCKSSGEDPHFARKFTTWERLTRFSFDFFARCVKSETVWPGWRAILRLDLGLAQMIGAASTAALLIQSGVSLLVLWGVVLTGLVTVVNIVLFRVVWREK